MTLIVVLSIIIIGFIEGVPLIKDGAWKEFAVITIILMIAISIQLGSNFGMETPRSFLQKCFEPIGKAIFKHTLS